MFAKESITNELEVREVFSSLTSYYLKLLGSYPYSTKIDNHIKRLLILADKQKNFVVSCITEPHLFFKKQELSWFEYFHDACSEINFPIDKIVLLTCNIYAAESYENWCKHNNVLNKMLVISQTKHYWIKRLIDAGYHVEMNIKPSKHISCFIGRPRLHKNYIVKWYIENIQNTEHENNVIGTFLYGNLFKNIFDESMFEKIKHLPGKIEDGSSDHTHTWMTGDPKKFNSAFSMSLVDFIVDYVEFEDFYNYENYEQFKKSNPWWHEDVLSEKTFQCVLLKKPFIRLGMPHSLKKFREWGFKTFDNVLFDENYDNIENFYDRKNHILAQVENLLHMPFENLKNKVFSNDVQDILKHNYKVAYEIYDKHEDILNV